MTFVATREFAIYELAFLFRVVLWAFRVQVAELRREAASELPILRLFGDGYSA